MSEHIIIHLVRSTVESMNWNMRARCEYDATFVTFTDYTYKTDSQVTDCKTGIGNGSICADETHAWCLPDANTQHHQWRKFIRFINMQNYYQRSERATAPQMNSVNTAAEFSSGGLGIWRLPIFYFLRHFTECGGSKIHFIHHKIWWNISESFSTRIPLSMPPLASHRRALNSFALQIRKISVGISRFSCEQCVLFGSLVTWRGVSWSVFVLSALSITLRGVNCLHAPLPARLPAIKNPSS